VIVASIVDVMKSCLPINMRRAAMVVLRRDRGKIERNRASVTTDAIDRI